MLATVSPRKKRQPQQQQEQQEQEQQQEQQRWEVVRCGVRAAPVAVSSAARAHTEQTRMDSAWPTV